jgi:Tfp pilus assembly protein PilZ
MTDSHQKDPDTTDMDYLTKLMDEADVEGAPLLQMVDTTRRQYLRKPCFMAVDYASDGIVHKGFITNVSANGVFVEAAKTADVGRHITMTFSSPGLDMPIKISGRIVWCAQEGIGIALPVENKNLRSMVAALG